MKAGCVPVVRRLSVVTIIGVAAATLAISPVLASAPTRAPGDSPRGLAASQMTLAQAPTGLQIAARSALGLSSHSLEQQKLTGSDVSSAVYFGTSVSISGSSAVVGTNGGSGGMGAAYVFVFSGTTWTEQAKLIESNTPYSDFFGSAVTISGSTVMSERWITMGTEARRSCSCALGRPGARRRR
jgi:FG-GAP repeat protein